MGELVILVILRGGALDGWCQEQPLFQKLTAGRDVNSQWLPEGSEESVADGITPGLIPEVGATPRRRHGNEIQADRSKGFPRRLPLVTARDSEMGNLLVFATPAGPDRLLD